LLNLHGQASEENLQRSDRICSALQLINFMQDLHQDLVENDRIYLPEDEMARFGVSIEDLHRHSGSSEMIGLVDHQLARIRRMMKEGAPLGRDLPGRFGLEIRLITEGGLKVLDKLEAHHGQPWQRPRLNRSDYLSIAWRALFSRS
jgi:hydroxysqualene synthase